VVNGGSDSTFGGKLMGQAESIVAGTKAITRVLTGLVVSAAVLALAGCAGNTSTGGDPGARALPPGQSCQTIRGELNKLDARGVPSRIEAAQAGRKLPPAQQTEVDQYNKLLGDYLGARCHVAPTPH
jgi:hypothetical protein